MEFAEVVRRRRMVRNYDPDRPVPPETVDRLLAHAVRAPSAGFAQGWGFLVLEEPADRDRFWAAATPDGGGRERWLAGMRRAPLIVVPHANRDAYLDRYAEPDKGWADRAEERWPVPYWYVDTGFAALLMLLTAVDEGLGACFFGIPPQRIEAYRDAFGVPPELHPIGAVTIGYRAVDHRSPSLRRGRRPVDDVVRRGRWS
ncbi:nitroreductase family protein [Micromonospora sp. WMMD1128]|uniref:nitroreductase family protein n=1 Tax=unclassified Micromonospora TaxID=2617518 RepID=UPI00248C65F7|nr:MULTISPECIES: nitroreductase family protein [unclassified Micromonospora]WBB73151.1 nitroreductase family protein [Micromonospora sp. WMMD1128]WFE33395.1 nitroreductase family protein [Micromonospora sp. WMMD975]